MFVQATTALMSRKIHFLGIRLNRQSADSHSNRAASIGTNDYVASFPPRCALETVRETDSAGIHSR